MHVPLVAEGKLQHIDPVVLTKSGDALTLNPQWVEYLAVSMGLLPCIISSCPQFMQALSCPPFPYISCDVMS